MFIFFWFGVDSDGLWLFSKDIDILVKFLNAMWKDVWHQQKISKYNTN